MSGLVLQTQADAPPGLLADWAEHRGLALELVRVDERPALPDPRGFDFAVLLGSTASIVERREPWIAGVLEWLRAADAAAVPILGICFGAQALAAALGGRAYRLPEPEIGWVTVATAAPERIPAGPWVAWHEDGFKPPPLADELARNACGVQAFALRGHLGVQFHPEATRAIAIGWDRERRHGFGAGPAQTAAEQLFDAFAARAALTTA